MSNDVSGARVRAARQFLVVERLPRLHDAHNGRLDGVLAVLVDGGARRVLLLLRDLGRDHRDLDAASAVGEARVVRKDILLRHLRVQNAPDGTRVTYCTDARARVGATGMER
eukprot:4333694-Pleurochrysis_carterae.AAC.4